MNYYHRWEYQILTHISLQLQTLVLWYIVHMCTDHQVWSVQCDMLSWCLKPPCRGSCSDARCREWQLIEEGIRVWSQIKEETWISWKKQISCLITPSTFSYSAFTDNSAQTAFKCRLSLEDFLKTTQFLLVISEACSHSTHLCLSLSRELQF